MHYHVGTSGYQYRHWRERFYPADIPQRRWLAYYAEHFDSVEINATFYRLPELDKIRRWCEEVPEDFRFVPKFSRYGSHIKRLKDPSASIGPFREIVEAMGDQLGAVLLQLPPNWRAQPERLDAFLAEAHWPWAVELRDPRWLCDEVFEVLGRHNAALCLTDGTADQHWRLTADWSYLRFHGSEHTEPMGETRRQRWTDWLRRTLPGQGGAWVFFNNDGDARAPFDARAFRDTLAAA
jgi:uncharacterized protein YecE (DUF72 family)